MLRNASSRSRSKPPKRGRPVRRPATAPLELRGRILDCAEALFALHGFHGVTIREVGRSAAVDPALVHYYFETKKGLFDAVFERRAEVVNFERIRSMNAYARAAGNGITIEGCVEAFLEPILRHSLSGDAGWKNYFRLLALVNNTPEWGGAMMTRYFDPVIHRLIDLLRKCMPGTSEENLFWSYHFLSGALTLSLSETGRIDRLSGGLCSSADMQALHRRMVPFIAAGFRRVCQTDPQDE
jgi:AcrR family transcriptional regulator